MNKSKITRMYASSRDRGKMQAVHDNNSSMETGVGCCPCIHYNHNHHHHPKTQRHRGGNRACHLFERHGVATGETMIGMRTSRIHSRPYSAGSPASSRASFKVYSTVRVSRACYTILYYQVRCTAVYLCLPPFSSFFFFLFFPIYHIRPYFLSSSY